MAQYIDKSAIVAEIERRISVLKANESVISMLAGGMFVNEFKDLLSFLDTLEVKEIGVDLGDPKGDMRVKTVWTDLEEAANSCSSCIYLEEVLSDDDKEVLKERLVNTFKAGAKWGKEQAEIQIKAQSTALPHGCPKKEPVSEDLEEAARKTATWHSRTQGDMFFPNDYHKFIAGAQWQNDKACKWLKENKDHPLIGCEDPCLSGYLTDKFIEEFKKAMEK